MNSFGPQAHSEFRRLLQKSLEERVEKNPRFSIRSFARLLKVNDSTLSQVLRGTRNLSWKKQAVILEKLGYDRLLSSDPANPLPRASYEIDHWLDDAIIEAMKLKNFEASNRWIARELNVTVAEVHGALERLEKCGYIDRSRPFWQCALTDSTNVVEGVFTNESMKRYQRLLSELSLRAMQETPRPERDHSSIVFAIDPADLPEIKEEIKAFRRRMLARFDRAKGAAHRVVACQVGFFPLSKIEEIEPNGDLR